jgi:zinc protease
MKNRSNFKILSALFLLATMTVLSVYAQAQNFSNPRQEKLLNGLKVLMWNDPKAEKVSVKIRVHSGSSFDPQGKEGVMQLLADNIFPSDSVREFFTEDLGGGIEITTNHDYIQITATAKNEEFLTMLETLANAVSKPTIDKETTAKLRDARLEKAKELEKDPAYVADQAAARRLFGTFPYGRPVYGTTETLRKIDYADLIFAKDRFFTADNATITIHGNVKSDLAFRAARRFFGAWAKSENRVPSSFTQPVEPDTKPFGIKLSTAGNSEIRYALRGLARNDKDYAASEILTVILKSRLQNLIPNEYGTNFQVRHDAHILPGLMILGYTSQPVPVITASSSGTTHENLPNNAASLLLAKNVTKEEFDKAKAEVLSGIKNKPVSDWWLDADTFRLVSVQDELQSFETVTPTDVQRVAEKLAKNPVVRLSVMQTGENAAATKN